MPTYLLRPVGSDCWGWHIHVPEAGFKDKLPGETRKLKHEPRPKHSTSNLRSSVHITVSNCLTLKTSKDMTEPRYNAITRCNLSIS